VAASTPDVARAADQLAWDKTFPQSDKVIHQKVSFHNRLGISLAADLYIPMNLDRSKKHPAIVVGGPYGAVKEQSAGLYAQTMAERGFVTIAHDPSYNGESGGQPHFTASFEALIEDFSAANGLTPQKVEPLLGRATSYLAIDKAKEAAADLDEAVQSDPNSAPAWSARGQAYERLGDKAKAAASYGRAIALRPKDDAARSGLARTGG
jgi:fermentation-respiration switch protein FrsA (DUF1100 family)